MRRALVAGGALAVLAAFTAACGDDDDDDDDGGGAEVDVVLGEYVVEPSPASTAAGSVTFVADNQGSETHEFVVVRAASAAELPVDELGAFDEEAFGEENVLGEVEDIASGEDAELTLDLEAGSYVLLCNVVEEEEAESHFAEGMSVTFTVT